MIDFKRIINIFMPLILIAIVLKTEFFVSDINIIFKILMALLIIVNVFTSIQIVRIILVERKSSKKHEDTEGDIK